MAKIFKGDVNFGFVINQTGAQPLDSRSVVQNYAELLKSETFGKAIYNGMTVATIDEQKVYMLIDDTKATSADGWKEVGAGGAVAVDTYADAVVLATNDNIGQVIFVKTSDETYERAPYIVTGEGNLQKLAASNSDGTGLDADVAKLKETVGDANSGLVQSVGLKVNTSDFETYQVQVSDLLAGKVDMSTFETHVSNFEEFTTSVSTTLDSHADTLTSISTTLTSISDKLDTHVSEYTTFVETTNNTLGSHATALTSISTTLTSISSDLTTHVSEYTTFVETTNNTLDSHATTLTSISSELATHVSAFESYKTEVSDEFKGVSEAFVEVTTNISTLTSNFNTFKNSYITEEEIVALFNTNPEQ